MARKKKTTTTRQTQKQKQSVTVNIVAPAPKRRRARRRPAASQPVMYREFQKVVYSDANPIVIYENQNRYKNLDARPATKSDTLSKLEDVGQVGTEGRVEILDRPTRREQLDTFITPVPLEMNKPQGDNVEMKLPTNAAKDLMEGLDDIREGLKNDLSAARKGFDFGEFQEPIKPAASSIKNIKGRKPPTEEQKAKARARARATYLKKKYERIVGTQ